MEGGIDFRYLLGKSTSRMNFVEYPIRNGTNVMKVFLSHRDSFADSSTRVANLQGAVSHISQGTYRSAAIA